MATRRMKGSATFFISMAVCTRVGTLHGLEHALHGEGVHHRGEHAHVVGGGALHAAVAGADAAPEIAAPDHQPDLDAGLVGFFDLIGHALDDLGRDVVLAARFAQRFSAELEDHSFETTTERQVGHAP